MLYQFSLTGDTNNSLKNKILFSLVYYSQPTVSLHEL